MEVWYAELQDERGDAGGNSSRGPLCHARADVPDQSARITVTDEQRGHLPKWGRARDSDAEKTYYVPTCAIVEDDNYRLDSDENGQYV
eukprot:1763050-Pyramimonas_sp.AAC.1